jgi:RNA polymerase sigma-70 factor (ECF subfamily)
LESAASEQERRDEFTRLFTRHQRHVYVFIRSLVGNPTDVEEIWQETNLILWRKFDEFELGTNFIAWARRIAYFEIRAFQAKSRRSGLQFSEQFVEALSTEAELARDLEEERLLALRLCMTKLSRQDETLIRLRYSPGASGESVAAACGRSVRSVYKAMTRIRQALLECVRRRLATEAGQ